MNATLKAQSAYTQNQTAIRTPRSIEAQLLGSITSELRKTSENKSDYAAFVDALHRNRKMWVTFATGVADKDNTLPETLRAQLFYLAEFTEHHSRKVLKGDATVQPLIEINTSVLRGLNQIRASK